MKEFPSPIRLTANISRPADNTAYQAGDAIANSATQSAVVPLTFVLPSKFRRGTIFGAEAVVTPASGNLVITALDFDLLLFRPAADIPYAAGSFIGDNVTMPLPAAAFREIIGVFPFVAGAWRNPLGALTAAAHGWQSVVGTPAGKPRIQFDIDGADASPKILGLIQVKGAWTPTGVINRFDFTLNAELQY